MISTKPIMFKQGRIKRFYPLPKTNQKTCPLPCSPQYVMFQDGSLYSTKSGKFLTKTKDINGIEIYSFKRPNGVSTTITIAATLRKLFHNQLPDIEGVEHKPIEGYQGLYQFYSNGKVWSYRNCMFLVGAINNGKYYVSLVNQDGIVSTFYPHKFLDDYFGKEN